MTPGLQDLRTAEQRSHIPAFAARKPRDPPRPPIIAGTGVLPPRSRAGPSWLESQCSSPSGAMRQDPAGTLQLLLGCCGEGGCVENHPCAHHAVFRKASGTVPLKQEHLKTQLWPGGQTSDMMRQKKKILLVIRGWFWGTQISSFINKWWGDRWWRGSSIRALIGSAPSAEQHPPTFQASTVTLGCTGPPWLPSSHAHGLRW